MSFVRQLRRQLHVTYVVIQCSIRMFILLLLHADKMTHAIFQSYFLSDSILQAINQSILHKSYKILPIYALNVKLD